MADLTNNWLSYLSEEDIKSIDVASKRVLSEVGIRFEDAELTEKLMDKGCTNKDGRLQIPSDLIDAAVSKLPDHITYIGRDLKELKIGKGKVATHTGGSIPYVYDLETGLKRNASLEDLENMLRLMNHLEHLSMCGALVQPQEVHPGISELIQMTTVFRIGQKPGSGSAISTVPQARYTVELYKVLMAELENPNHYPLLTVGISPESPLYYPAEIVGIMKLLIANDIPTLALVAPILGFTAPMTIAGGLAQMNASLLAYAVISHEINPDTPVIYGARLCMANMSNAQSIWGVPEVGMIGAGSVQLAKYYGLPSDVYGYSSSSCTHDLQLAAEASVNGLLPLLAGANIISGFGSFGSGYLASFEDLVFDNELFGMHLRTSQGLKIDADHLAVEVIANAMDGKDYFLQKHTLKHLRTGELSKPKIGLYGLIKDWEEKEGSKDFREKAREEVKRILAQNEDHPLPEAVDHEFEKILKAAETELC